MSLKQAPTNLLSIGPSGTVGSSPQHQASLDSSFDISKKLQLDVVYRFASSLPAQQVATYSTGDFRVGYQLNRHLDFPWWDAICFSRIMWNIWAILRWSRSGAAFSRL
jgi:hypothetical protein